MGRKLQIAMVVLVLAALSLAAEAAPLQPLIIGWERFFRLDWEPGTREGRPVVSGYLLNDGGMPAGRISLLVEGLDASHEVVSQQVVRLSSVLTPGSRAYFEVTPARPAVAYRVSLFAFDWIRTPSGG